MFCNRLNISGILLALNAVCHIICLLSELINVIFIIFLSPFTRRQCYPFIALYIFSSSQQTLMTLAISVDLLVALLFPLWTTPYVTTIFTFCSLYSLPISMWGLVTQDDEVIQFCNPPLGLTPTVSRYWSISSIVLNCLVLLVYAAIIAFVKLRGTQINDHCEEHKVVRRLKVLVIVFVLSWFMCILGVDIGHALGLGPDLLPLWQSNMVS
ncbi:unnamed protein product [Strongylus vulgaris]|uniref:G-protein coupled receptors family 1 profile domain-containing protein n=1 Tax=Strongylus vulgaris TaxID=40348 RepID=A0A3P7K9T5_STRVU|nr:unnamed protein product [Strongylus vulgaris]